MQYFLFLSNEIRSEFCMAIYILVGSTNSSISILWTWEWSLKSSCILPDRVRVQLLHRVDGHFAHRESLVQVRRTPLPK